MEPEPETTLHVRRARAGDAESLAWLVRRLSPLLLAQARYRLGPVLRRAVDPEDVVQDVWAVALPALGAIEPRAGRETATLVRFLATTLLFRVNELARRRARQGPEVEPRSASRLARDDPREETAGALTRLAREEARGAVLAAIETLDERDREAIVLRGIEQLSNERAAELVGDTPNALSLRYNRALAKLRARLPGSVLDELPEENPENP